MTDKIVFSTTDSSIIQAIGLMIIIDDGMRQMIADYMKLEAEKKVEVRIVIDGVDYDFTLQEFIERLTR